MSILPQDGFEEMLVDDMARPRWRLLRLNRAERGIVAVQRRALELDGEWRAHRSRQAMQDGFQSTETAVKGLVGTPDCPEKFEKILDLLKTFRDEFLLSGFKRVDLGALQRHARNDSPRHDASGSLGHPKG